MSLLIFTAIGLIFASSVNTEQVRNFAVKPESRCQIYNVFIDPCPEALENSVCELVQGNNASINFKYTPGFSSNTPKTRLYAVTPILDLPFMDMDTNACLYTKCPMVANTESSWSYNLYISELYPRQKYTVKFKFWNDDSNVDLTDKCVFTFDLKIV